MELTSVQKIEVAKNYAQKGRVYAIKYVRIDLQAETLSDAVYTVDKNFPTLKYASDFWKVNKPSRKKKK